jgi:hypothetical protein
LSKWQVICSDGDDATYWQYTDCSWQCEEKKNPPIYVMDAAEDAPDREQKQEQVNTNPTS